MTKRKREPKEPAPDETSEDAAAKDDMVHVTPDLLAGSPDIFAGKKSQPAAAPVETPAETQTVAGPAEASAEPAPPAEPEPEPSSAAEQPQSMEPMSTPPATVTAVPYQPPTPSRGGSSTALGIVLVVVGAFALAVVLSGADLTQYGWPLFIIIPGLTLMVVGFLSVGAVATVPGGIVTMTGVVLAYCNATGDWPFWAYGWSLVTPGGVGLGIYLQALRDHDQNALRTGRTLLFISLLIFLIGFVLFESILGISGRDYFGPYGKAAFPVLMILVGVILLVRRMQQSRQG
ncbi:MAG TPA: hypothetical protein VJP81_10575 [Candidatus Dormibacteraeota bacterium]|nr:hypothetical protein [Candidatus Dormibacteraeota bacterium]